MYKLRGHHMFWLLGYRGIGYYEEYVENMTHLHQTLRNNPKTSIQIVRGPDQLCEKFPETGEYHCENSHIYEQDTAILMKLKLDIGQILTWEAIESRMHTLTDFISSKKGMWVTVGVWLALTIILAALAPSARDYEVSQIDPFPDDTQYVVAEQKMDHDFSENDGIPAILVFQAKEGKLPTTDVSEAVKHINEKNIHGLTQVVPLAKLPPKAQESF